MKNILLLFLVPCSLHALNFQDDNYQGKIAKMYLYECIQGNNNSCRKLIALSPRAEQTFRKLQRKEWLKNEMLGRNLYPAFIACKKTNKGKKRFLKKLIIHMELNRINNRKHN